ncbi:head maturation protease, ClpP-related [Rhodovulum sp. ES.010]|uniref:head maturation protease, ClpP-related n=1 Tax=Rhodovulum sp. ES.010 TaxID=1882821 RepID=UPI0009F827C2
MTAGSSRSTPRRSSRSCRRSVFDAVAIHNALKRHEGTVTVWIDGIAASAASYIAMAGDEIVMPENAFLMIHDPAGLVIGTAEDMRAMAEALDKVKGSLVTGYATKSGRTPEEVSALMAAETWFDASNAVAQGFADRLIEPVRIAARFDIGRFRNAPPVLVEQVEAEPEPNAESDGREIEAEESADDVTGGDEVADAEDEPPAAPDAPQPPIETPRPSGAPPDPAAIRSEAIGHAQAVIDLCRLAGQPQMAGRFLEQDMSLDEVRAALLAGQGRGGARDRAPSPAARPLVDRAPLGRDRRPHLQAERMTP